MIFSVSVLISRLLTMFTRHVKLGEGSLAALVVTNSLIPADADLVTLCRAAPAATPCWRNPPPPPNPRWITPSSRNCGATPVCPTRSISMQELSQNRKLHHNIPFARGIFSLIYCLLSSCEWFRIRLFHNSQIQNLNAFEDGNQFRLSWIKRWYERGGAMPQVPSKDFFSKWNWGWEEY